MKTRMAMNLLLALLAALFMCCGGGGSGSNNDAFDETDDEQVGGGTEDPGDNPILLHTYAIVDTGQAACYDDFAEIPDPAAGEPFSGQDAQHQGNQPNYADHGDGTVTDLVTGLMWQQGSAPYKLTFAEAQAYVDTLNTQIFAGYTDWRLPTIKELYSLIDFRGMDPPPEGTDTSGLVPFIDTATFDFEYGDTSAGERIIDSQWATSTLYVANSRMLFGVNFADGRIKGYGLSSPDPMQGEKTFSVRLCRGNPDYGKNAFTDHDDGTVTDAATGLMWTKSDSGFAMNWEDALAFIEEMNAENLFGHNDWRLPDAKELQSIVDYSRSPDTANSAAIDPVFNTSLIVNMAGQDDYPFFWSGTTHLSADGNGGRAVYVAFGRGMGTYDGVNITDVHGAGCQRSDPKDGDPEDYPNAGNGPQGDVSRVFNHVRLVRDAE
jgi:Protein of unknown function (DUF1566)